MGFLTRVAGFARSVFGGGGSRSSASIRTGDVRNALGGNTPGDWASDHEAESRHFTGWVYVSLNSICKAAAQAKLDVLDSPSNNGKPARPIRKSVSGAMVASSQQGEQLPLDHPLVRLLTRPSPRQSGASFRYEQVMQLGLTGTCLIINFRRNGLTYERYVVPTSQCQPQRPSAEAPNGGYRINPRTSALRYDEDGFFQSSVYMHIIGRVIPIEWFTVIRWPHPLYKDDGLSPLAAGATWADLSAQVDEARINHNRNGMNPSAIVSPPEGVSPDERELARVEMLLNQKYAGARNAGKIMVAAHGAVSTLGNTPREMAYEHGFDQSGQAIRALYSVPGAAVGLQDGMTYGAIAASMRQHSILAVQPYLDLIADEETEQLSREFGHGMKVQLTAPSVDDPDLIERQIGLDLQAGTITRGEIRKLRGRPLFGDERDDQVAGAIGMQEAQAKAQAAQAGGAPGMPPGAPGAEAGSNPLAMLAAAAGANAGAEPGVEAGAQPGPTDRPPMPPVSKTLIAKPDGIVMLVLPADVASDVLAVQSQLDPADVVEFEGEPHVSVRYGVAGAVQEVQRAVAGFGVAALTLGDTDVFSSPEQDVLFIRAEGNSLRRLRDRVEDRLQTAVDTHGEYKPHVTIAYLKPGAGKKYLGLATGLEGMPVAFSEVAYRVKEGGAWRVGLVGAGTAAGINTAPVVRKSSACGPECECDECKKKYLAGTVEKTLQAFRASGVYRFGEQLSPVPPVKKSAKAKLNGHAKK